MFDSFSSCLPPARVLDRTQGYGFHGVPDCCGHAFGGLHTVGASTVLVENSPVTRLADIGFHYCPHCPINMNISCKTDVWYENAPVHCISGRVTEFCGFGSSTSGARTVFEG